MARLRADLLLFLAALIWGTAFVAQKTASETMGPFLFVGCRFVISAALLLPLAWIEQKRDPVRLSPRDWRLGGLVGLSLFGNLAMQQIGITTTSATNAGFLTAIYVAMVPVVAWLLTREKPRWVVVAACAVSLFGAYLLEQNGLGTQWSVGDFWVLAADVLAALQILLVTRFLAQANRPFLLSFLQYAVTGVLGLLIGILFEPVSIKIIGDAGISILYAGVLSGAVGFTLQIIAQRHTPAAEAAIIMSLESVFAALSGAWLLGDRLSGIGIAGCCLILFGVLMVQLAPLWRRNPLDALPSGSQDSGDVA
jgi:drug/metabolite transporter (DMT)-like permease